MTLWLFISSALLTIALVSVISFWPVFVGAYDKSRIVVKDLFPVSALVICMAAVIGLIYYGLGEPRVLTQSWLTEPAGDRQLNELLADMEKKLADDVNNPEAWLLLSRGQMIQGNYAGAVESLEQAYSIVGEDVDVMVRLADAHTMNNQGTVNQRALDILLKAYKIDSLHQSLLWLLAMAYEQRAEVEQAVNYWQQLEKVLDQDPELQQQVRQQIARLTAVDTSYSISITLASALAEEIEKDATLFIFATEADGPPMPIAAIRMRAGDLPTTIQLDDSDSLLPNRPLSGFEGFVVTARISKSNEPEPRAGDLFGSISILSSQADLLHKLEINQKI